MKYWAFLFIAFLLVVPSGSASENSPETTAANVRSQQEFDSVEREWNVQIVFVNYEQELIDQSTLLGGLPSLKEYAVGSDEIRYFIEYDISFANQSYASSLQNVILENSFNGTDTGSIIDEDALEYQKENPNDPQRIFYPRDGRVIDAHAVEDWMFANPAVEPPKPGYILYFMNYSIFDSEDHSIEHWYDYHPVDPDSGEEQDWFRLEWDNSLNQDVKFEYPAFGGRYNFFVIDPSADQWYLRWARIWWGNGPDYDAAPQYCTMDLEDKMNPLSSEDTQLAQKLSTYLNEWAYDPVNLLFFPQQNSPTAYVDSGFFKGLIFAMDVDDGITVDSLKWVTDAEMQEAHLSELLPFIEWEVDIEYLNIQEHPEWNDLFWDHASTSGGKVIVDGMGMFNDIYDNMRHRYVDIFSDDIEVFGTVFIKKNMEMHVYGRQFTGLGGGGQTCIWKAWERYYRPDGVTPKSGISHVQLHETMHAVGIGHTWNTHHYVADFSKSPMGYYGRFNGTGIFDRNWIQGTYLDQKEGRLKARYGEHDLDIRNSPLEKTDYAHEKYEYYLNLAHEEYAAMNWTACYAALENAEDWLTRAIYSMADQDAPVIEKWNISWNDGVDEDIVWAKVRDDLSGVDNVTVHVEINNVESVFVCENSMGNWSASVGILPNDSYVRIWVEARDWGLNVAKSEVMEFGTVMWPSSEQLILIGIVAPLSIAVIIVLWNKKRQGV